jgi:isoleucyl-tRNA synthetase
MVQFAVSPNLKTLGPKLKENAAEVSKLLSKVDENELVKHLRTKGRIRLGGFDLEEEDIIVSEKNKPGFSHSSLGDIHVYVALEITPNLKLEGLSREVIRRVQRMRKDQRLEFEDPVEIEYTAHADIETAITAHKTHIMRETHATSLTKRDAMTGGTKWIVNKLLLELSLKRSAL